MYINQIRDLYINKKVKEFLSRVINKLGIRNIVEYGCGYSPIDDLLSKEINYFGLDINPNVIKKNKEKHGNFISVDENKFSIESSLIDLIVSVFVFHFNITYHQVTEMKRILKEDGLLKVYRLNDEFKRRV